MGSGHLAQFVTLPTETLTLIFSNFCLHCCGEYDQPCDVGTVQMRQAQLLRQRPLQEEHKKSWHYLLYRRPLCSLSRVSRRFRDIAQPILHHEFAHGHGNSWCSKGFKWNKRLVLFMRTMSQRRDLASVVKVVSLQWKLFQPIRKHDASKALTQCADAMGIDLPKAWRQRALRLAPLPQDDAMAKDFSDFLVSFLDGEHGLSTSTISELRRKLDSDSGIGKIWIAAELFAMLLAQLPNLEYLSIRNSDIRFRLCCSSALSALNVSSLPLKTFDSHIFANPILELASGLQAFDIRSEDDLPSPIPPMPNLSVLRVSRIALAETRLRDLLSACTGGLRTFAYEMVPDRTRLLNLYYHGFFKLLPLSAIIRHLQTHRETLSCLHLALYNDNEKNNSPALTFKDFVALEHLLLSPNILPKATHDTYEHPFLIQNIPPSIKSLNFRSVDRVNHTALREELVGLAELKALQPQQFPSLRRVICDKRHIFEDNEVAVMLAAADIYMAYTNWDW